MISYRQIVAEGILGVRQKMVYEKLRDLDEATDYEIALSLEKKDPNFVRPRRKELVDFGLVEEYQKRKCSVTGRLAIAWRAKTKTRINENLRKRLMRRQKTLGGWIE